MQLQLLKLLQLHESEVPMFIKRADARLFSLSFGHGAHTLLAMGGWIGSGEVWHDVFGCLPYWRCVSFDHRGSGVSAHGSTPISIEAMVDDVFAVMDAQGIKQCVLAAESSGAGVALEVAHRAPERVLGLVLVGASWQRASSGKDDNFIASLRKDFDATLRAFAAACVPEPDSADVQRWGYQVLRRASVLHAIELLQCQRSLTIEDRLGDIKAPSLLLHGTLDRIVAPSQSALLAQRLPNAELHLMAGLGHVPILTAPAEVARLIEQRFDCVALKAAA